ncbi:hypothetical protein DFH27DRAFT_51253 [Peziza echinospora]|nr:hypothetical protein DFH27DRAFT_51253 [Peziza echinospora]
MSRPKSPRRSHSPTVSTSTTTTNIENHNHSHDDLDPISPVLQPIATIPTRPQNLTNCSSRLTRTGSILNGSLVLVRTTTNPANIIPRDQRRGILGRSKIVWIPEIRDPYEYTNAVKFTITLIVGLAGASAPMGSSVLFRKYPVYFS